MQSVFWSTTKEQEMATHRYTAGGWVGGGGFKLTYKPTALISAVNHKTFISTLWTNITFRQPHISYMSVSAADGLNVCNEVQTTLRIAVNKCRVICRNHSAP